MRFKYGELFSSNHEIFSEKHKFVWQTSAGNVRFLMCDLCLCLRSVTCEGEPMFEDTQITDNYL